MQRRWLSWLAAVCLVCAMLGGVGATLLLGSSQAVAQETININTADEKELTKLPGIGKVTAARIIEHRTANGPFKSAADLRQVKGVGEKTLAKFEAMISFGPGGAAAPAPVQTAEPAPKEGRAGKAMPQAITRGGGDDTIDLTQAPVKDGARSQPGPSEPGKGAAAPAPAGGAININTADEKALTKLPGVGKVTAARIIEHRTANGPFKSVDDLSQVKGIGKATLEKLRSSATVQ